MRRMAMPTVLALMVGVVLSGCSGTTSPEPEAASANVAICLALADSPDDGPFWVVAEHFAAYTSNRDAVAHTDITDALAMIDEMSAGATGDVASAFQGMRTVFEDIEKRYTGSDPLHPVDYQAYQDEANNLIDACLTTLESD